VLLGKPLVDASVFKWEAQATVYLPGRGCYRCLFPVPPAPGTVPSCAQAGVLGAVAGFMGTCQAIEAVKILLGLDTTLANRLLIFDALRGEVSTIAWQRNRDCPVCGDSPTIRELIDYDAFCGVPGRHPVTVAAVGAAADVSPDEAARLMREEQACLLDVREPWEWESTRIPGATLIPEGEVTARIGEIPTDRPVVVYCAIGERSAAVVAWLRGRGYDRAVNLTGGIAAWSIARLPVERPCAS
jgi:adenylyltransferase/sulfurtransferase